MAATTQGRILVWTAAAGKKTKKFTKPFNKYISTKNYFTDVEKNEEFSLIEKNVLR